MDMEREVPGEMEERKKKGGHRTELRKHRYLNESGEERETNLKFLRNTHKGLSNIGQRSRASR